MKWSWLAQEYWGCLANGYGLSFGGDQNVLELDRSGGGTTQ